MEFSYVFSGPPEHVRVRLVDEDLDTRPAYMQRVCVRTDSLTIFVERQHLGALVAELAPFIVAPPLEDVDRRIIEIGSRGPEPTEPSAA